RVEHRMAGGLNVNAFYTWSKSLNENEGDGVDGGVTYYSRRLEKGRSSTDIRNRFVSVMNYELPFGKGRRWMNHGGVLNHALGGGEPTWTQTCQWGQPITVSFTAGPNPCTPRRPRPNNLTTNERALLPDCRIVRNGLT